MIKKIIKKVTKIKIKIMSKYRKKKTNCMMKRKNFNKNYLK